MGGGINNINPHLSTTRVYLPLSSPTQGRLILSFLTKSVKTTVSERFETELTTFLNPRSRAA